MSSTPQHITADVATTVGIDIPSQPDAATVSLYTGGGAPVFEDEDAAVSTIDTTLDGAVSAGDETLVVDNATGISSGVTAVLASPSERVLIRSLTTKTATLARPLAYNHPDGAAIEGCRLTYSVSSDLAATKFDDGRLEWTITATGQKFIQAACCTAYPFQTNMAHEQDLLDQDPLLLEKLPKGADTGRMLSAGAREVISRLSSVTGGRPFTFPTVPQFTPAVCLAALLKHYEPQPSERAAVLYERYKDALERELDLALSGIAYRDADQDGAVERHEQRAYGFGRRMRA